MKWKYKTFYIILSFCMLLILCSCGTKQAGPTIKPIEFPEEVQSVLQPLDPDTKFFDFTTDKSITHAVIAMRCCEDGTWNDPEPILELSDMDVGSYHMILRWIDDRIDAIISEDGVSYTSTYSIAQEHWDAFNASEITSTVGFGNEQPIVAGEEIPLWCTYGKNAAGISSQSLDFRNSDCDTGFAITITFS